MANALQMRSSWVYITGSCNLYAIYTVITTATNADGCTDLESHVVSVGTLPSPVWRNENKFTLLPMTICCET